MLVDLVSDDKGVDLLGQARDGFQLRTREHPARRIRRVAQNHRLGLLGKCALQVSLVKAKFRRIQRDIDRFCARQDRVGHVVLVERREHDDPIAGIARRHHGHHHGLGTAAGDHQVGVGIDVESHPARLLACQGPAKVRRTPGHRVLMRPVPSGLLGGPLQFLGRIEIRESLRQVDGSVGIRQPGHVPDDRLAELAHPMTGVRHGGLDILAAGRGSLAAAQIQ